MGGGMNHPRFFTCFFTNSPEGTHYCPLRACSLRSEYIIPSDAPKPTYIRQQNALTKYRQTSPELQTVHSQVL